LIDVWREKAGKRKPAIAQLDFIQRIDEKRHEVSENNGKGAELDVVLGHVYEIAMLKNNFVARVFPSRASVHQKR
jgi:hypothetical protein